MSDVRVKIKGLDKAIAEVNKAIGKIQGVTMGGLMSAGLLVQRRAQERVPVEYGNLRGSAYTRKTPENPKRVEVGFSAAYAFYVHENLEQKWKGQERRSGLGQYWGPKGEPKFLENALRDSKADILATVKASATGAAKKGVKR